MSKTFHAATALCVGTLLLLAGCGGQPDEASAPAREQARAAGTQAGRAPVAADTATAHAEPAVPVPEGEAPSLSQQVAVLRRDVAEIRQQLARTPGAAPSAAPAPDPRTDPVARLDAERAEQQRIAATESAFRGEKEDPRWSRDTTASVRAALGATDESFRNQVRGVECRSQSCRVVVGGEAGAATQATLSSVMMQLAATLPKVTAGQIDQGDGRAATVLYLSR
jgi:hypothetical protein